MSDEMIKVCDQEIETLLAKKAIYSVPYSKDCFVSNMFAIKKKRLNNEETQLYRPITNLKKLNCFVRYERFKMGSLDLVKYIIRKDDWMAKVDLMDAYFTVPLAADHQKFVCFIWKRKFYKYRGLPFGLSSAPRVFTKLLKPIVSYLRERGVRLVIYLDDCLILGETLSLITSHLDMVLSLIRRLGFPINERKSFFIPTQIMEFLGVVVNTKTLSFSLPTVKVQKVTVMCEKALRLEKISLRKLPSIMGNFSWAIPTVPYAQAHFRNLQRFYISESHNLNGNLDLLVTLPPSAISDLDWWYKNLQNFNGKMFLPDEPYMTIYSDASLAGWGACCNDETTRGPWTWKDRNRHINELELLGAFYALQVFSEHSRDISIHIYLDNSTSVSYINKCGGTRSITLCNLVADITKWCEYRSIRLSAFHLPGSLNLIVDRESRTAMDKSDWKLNSRIFQRILTIWQMEVDLFASAWNAQLPIFVRG